jgi:hypothetical protein
MQIKFIDERNGDNGAHQCVECDSYSTHLVPGNPEAKHEWKRYACWHFEVGDYARHKRPVYTFVQEPGTAIFIVSDVGKTVDCVYDHRYMRKQEKAAGEGAEQ